MRPHLLSQHPAEAPLPTEEASAQAAAQAATVQRRHPEVQQALQEAQEQKECRPQQEKQPYREVHQETHQEGERLQPAVLLQITEGLPHLPTDPQRYAATRLRVTTTGAVLQQVRADPATKEVLRPDARATEEAHHPAVTVEEVHQEVPAEQAAEDDRPDFRINTDNRIINQSQRYEKDSISLIACICSNTRPGAERIRCSDVQRKQL